MLVAAGCVVFLWLAQWQWVRAQSIVGDWQNLGYALQWPLFALFLAAAWLRFLWLEHHRDRGGIATQEPLANDALGAAVPDPPVPRAPASHGPASRLKPEDEHDDELAAYNAYLAQLADRNRPC